MDPELSERESAALYRENARATGRQLAQDAAAGDQIAVAALTRAGWALGLAIASATHLCDVDLVTIGGGLSQAGPLLFEPLEETLRAARADGLLVAGAGRARRPGAGGGARSARRG